MQLSEFDYELPPSLIPPRPRDKRGNSRMLVMNRATGDIKHDRFDNLSSYLREGDVVVLNNTKVMPTLLQGKLDNGGEVRVDLVSNKGNGLWECHIRRSRDIAAGTSISFGNNSVFAEVIGQNELKTGHVIQFNASEQEIADTQNTYGKFMLPLYLDQSVAGDDYQTIFASEPGSNQPPVAGMHFTENTLSELANKGIKVVYVTLNIGRLDDLGLLNGNKPIEEHRMYPEAYEVPEETSRVINEAHANGHRIVCVGTTAVRTLETVTDSTGKTFAKNGWTNHYITPGYKFKCADILLSNLQPPRSTNLMLHSAFGTHERVMGAYTEAVKENYQFLEFGDCILYI